MALVKIIGPNHARSEFELDPIQAYRRGRVLDAMLRSASLPVTRGVYRGSFAEFARIDAARMVAVARRLNTA